MDKRNVRLAATRTTPAPGTSLARAISRRLVKLYGTCRDLALTIIVRRAGVTGTDGHCDSDEGYGHTPAGILKTEPPRIAKFDQQANIVLAAMAAGGVGAQFDPVRIQKLLFLIDREVPRAGGPFFSFAPDDYGPFDGAVYSVLYQLETNSSVVVDRTGPYATFELSQAGYHQGQSVLHQFERRTAKSITRRSRWVLSLAFWELIRVVYRAYPDMAVNSRIPEQILRISVKPSVAPRPFLAGMTKLYGTWQPEDDPTADLSPEEQDWLAIASDWWAVGDDLRTVFGQLNLAKET